MMFYADWCPHCQQFAPTYKAAATHAAEFTCRDGAAAKLHFGAVSCVDQRALCDQFQVQSYPTLFFLQYKNGKSEQPKFTAEHNGAHPRGSTRP
jgi:thiol-disulfide isomerase/thioredoxin